MEDIKHSLVKEQEKQMNKIAVGIIVGILAGIIDVVPMIIMKLTWDANISAFSMWVAVCVLISTSNLKLPGAAKGIIIAFMVLSPSATLIGWKEPTSLIPISIMTTILGSISGLVIHKLTNKIHK